MTVADAYLAAAALLVDPHGRVLLFLRDDKPAIPFPGCWDMIGGRVEPGEPVAAAARREVLEECGYAAGDLLPYGVAAMENGYGGAPYELHVFYAPIDVPFVELRLSPDEGQALRFVEPEELDALPLAGNGRIVRDFFASPQYRELTQRGR